MTDAPLRQPATSAAAGGASGGFGAAAEPDPRGLPFLSAMPARPWDWRLAILFAVGSALAIILAIPYADLSLPRVPAFVPAYESALILNDLITAVLLFGQFRQLRTPSLLLLGSGYLFDAVVIMAHLLSFPEVFAPEGLLGGDPQTSPWLYVLWHGVFCFYIVAYAALAHGPRDAPVPSARVRAWIMGGVAAALALAAVSVLIATVGIGWLPTIIVGDDYSIPVRTGWAQQAWLFCFATLIFLWSRTRGRTVLDLWLLVVMLAWLLDVLLSTVFTTMRYDFGWYAGRFYGLLAASFVLVVLLLETFGLYTRLARSAAEARQRADELLASQEQLRESQKMEAIGRLTGGVAHDFNNLLTVMVSSLELIARQPDVSPRTTRLVNSAMRAAARGERLTQQLLIFARRQVTHPETVSLNRHLAELEPLLRQALGAGITLELVLDPALHPARVDVAQFEAAVLNVVVNARDAIPHDIDGRITIVTRNASLDAEAARQRRSAAPGDYAVVMLRDNGVGIPAALHGRVFDPFFTTKEIGKGSGLGLSQVYGFVTGSGGHVRLDSALGAGTCIEMWLPRSEAPTVGDPAPRPAAPSRPGAGVVLVVDDDPDVLEMAAETLDQLGYRTLRAANARDALARLESEPSIDLLFTDVVMPGGMNGAELALEARRRRPGLRVLLASGYTASALSSEHGIEGGDLPLLHKPYRREDLAEKLQGLAPTG